MTAQTCTECGARSHGRRCRMCGALLPGNPRPVPRRTQRKLLRRTDFMAAARQNERMTTRLVILLLLIGATLGYLIGWNLEIQLSDAMRQRPDVWFFSRWGVFGALALLLVGMVWSLVALTKGDRIVLNMTGAREVAVEEYPQLHNVVEEMAIAAGLPKPRVYVLDTPAPNAFATGLRTDRAAIGVTQGLLDTLNREELQAVIGHEMGHIVNLDMRYATAVGVLVGVVVLVADFGWRMLYAGGGRRRGSGGGGAGIALLILVVFALLAPLFAKLVQMAVSRQREFLADVTSVKLTRNSAALISALEKLADSAEPFKGANRATQHMFIVNPFRNFSDRSSRLLSTHPPMQRRIQRLMNLSG